MDELLKNKEFKSKMASLSPGVKSWFIDALVDLFEQESEYVIDVLEDCRYELGRTADDYLGEAEQLRAASRMLEDKRGDNGRSVSRADSRGAPSRLSLGNGDTGRRDRHRRRMVISDDDGRSASSLSVPSLPVGIRSPSPGGRSRSSPATPLPSAKAIQEETKALLQTMTDADAHAARERERQQERLERIRRQKKFLAEDRTTQAMKLLEKALEMDRVLATDKERQGKMLQDKLSDLKKRRSNNQSTAPVTTKVQELPVLEDLESY